MSDVPALLTAGGGLLTILGGGAAFVWQRFDALLKRERDANEALLERERAANAVRFAEIDAALEECRQREEGSTRRRATHMMAIELLLQEVERLSPRKSRVLARVKLLLDELNKIGD